MFNMALRCIVFGLAFCALCAPSFALRSAETCLPAQSLPLNGTVQIDGAVSSELVSLMLAVPAQGRLAVEIAVPGAEEATPWVALSSDCHEDAPAAGLRFVARGLGRQLIEVVTPGVYFLRVGVVEASRELGSYKISTRFLTEDLATKVGAGQETEAPAPGWRPKDGEEGDDTELVDNEILPLLFDPFASVRESCDAAVEPADDLSFCARRLVLGETVESSLDNAIRDDHDFFVFELEHAQRVRISGSGEIDTLGSLFDDSGHRLMRDDDGGDGDGFEILAELTAGRYAIRVEGWSGAEGSYRLTVDSAASTTSDE